MELPKTALPIKNAIKHWIDIDGSVYCIDGRNHHNKLIKKAQTQVNGYNYCGIRYARGVVNKRVHRLVAEAFIPNPHNYNIIGHRNNIKNDNRVSNLYWTTISENTKKAFDDGLLVNAKGFEDSQSKPVNMYDTYTNKLLNSFGSISIASESTNIPKQTISRQAKYKRPTRKPFYFRFIDDIDCLNNTLIGVFNYKTDKLVKTFISPVEAGKYVGVSSKTVNHQCRVGKPKYKHKYYCKYINSNKCEEIIENPVGE